MLFFASKDPSKTCLLKVLFATAKQFVFLRRCEQKELALFQRLINVWIDADFPRSQPPQDAVLCLDLLKADVEVHAAVCIVRGTSADYNLLSAIARRFYLLVFLGKAMNPMPLPNPVTLQRMTLCDRLQWHCFPPRRLRPQSTNHLHNCKNKNMSIRLRVRASLTMRPNAKANEKRVRCLLPHVLSRRLLCRRLRLKRNRLPVVCGLAIRPPPKNKPLNLPRKLSLSRHHSESAKKPRLLVNGRIVPSRYSSFFSCAANSPALIF